ncbi:hypothetical protein B484DRAFT_106693 [Ochromonadaceae sp. CCMP2298]|nr:hypothetical protein B484DRAFT_106693 [Ochromonadaceae sp. CCMP2298]|mmetsp:Transcript_3787/g.8549  ORF Transcript_3787/g.8549 Transcript_3787/m.8549 type:complete len:232 (+) Transcript_3787:800-1495(+)
MGYHWKAARTAAQKDPKSSSVSSALRGSHRGRISSIPKSNTLMPRMWSDCSMSWARVSPESACLDVRSEWGFRTAGRCSSPNSGMSAVADCITATIEALMASSPLTRPFRAQLSAVRLSPCRHRPAGGFPSISRPSSRSILAPRTAQVAAMYSAVFWNEASLPKHRLWMSSAAPAIRRLEPSAQAAYQRTPIPLSEASKTAIRPTTAARHRATAGGSTSAASGRHDFSGRA